MACKLSEIFTSPQIRAYVLIGVFSAYFLLQLVMSHLTHSMTLLIDAYHSLYSLAYIVGFVITIKMSRENSLKNTFGWARIEVLGMMISSLVLTALCFSVVVEDLQTIIHASHHDEMHHPLEVFGIGIAGIALNLIGFLFAGGFYYNNSFVSVESNDFQINITVPTEVQTTGSILLHSEDKLRRRFLLDLWRDLCCSVFVVITSAIVFMSGGNLALYIDPVLSIVSVIFLMTATYPFLYESGMILLQTTPVDVGSLKTRLLKEFPSITNVHDLHVWRLNRDKVIATIHIKIVSQRAYQEISLSVNKFFTQQGITLSTVQPEFETNQGSNPSLNSSSEGCILRCRNGDCQARMCCKEDGEEKGQQVLEFEEIDLTENIEVQVDDDERDRSVQSQPACSNEADELAADEQPEVPETERKSDGEDGETSREETKL